MTLSTLFFYLFAGMCVASAFMVIAVKNPVHAVLFLILAFFNAAGSVGEQQSRNSRPRSDCIAGSFTSQLRTALSMPTA